MSEVAYGCEIEFIARRFRWLPWPRRHAIYIKRDGLVTEAEILADFARERGVVVLYCGPIRAGEENER